MVDAIKNDETDLEYVKRKLNDHVEIKLVPLGNRIGVGRATLLSMKKGEPVSTVNLTKVLTYFRNLSK